MHMYKVSWILLIVPIVDFALAAPVLVQGKRQASIDRAGIPENPGFVLEKRGRMWGEIEEVGGEIEKIENWFTVPKEPSPAHGSSISAPAPKPGPSTDGQSSLSSAPAPKPGPGPSTASGPVGNAAPERVAASAP